jgi:hypothetical protein
MVGERVLTSLIRQKCNDLTQRVLCQRSGQQTNGWTNELKGDRPALRDYYDSCLSEDLPARLLAVLKKLDEETEQKSKLK